jgi:hypothetical protein
MKANLMFVVLACTLLVQGCSKGVLGESVWGRPGSPMWHKSASMETKVATFKRECSAIGFKYGSEGMLSCISSRLQNSENNAKRKMNSGFSCYTIGSTVHCN